MQHNMDKVAVVILNWNGREMLRRYLPSVLRYSPEAAVYVADNGSTDGSVDLLAQEFPQVRLIKLRKNFGFADGYNQALRQLEAEYVVLLNSDVEVTEHWLEPLTAYLEAHPETAACQPKLRSFHHRTEFEYAGAAGGYLDCWGYPFCRGRILNKVEADNGQYEDVVPVFWATGAALCIRLEDYWAAGGLDGRFFAHMEEIDLCWRLRSRGRGLVCVPQSVVYHVGAATLKVESPRKTYLNFRNNLLMLYKNLPDNRLAVVLRMRRLLDYVALLNFCLKGQWANARAVYQARRDFKRMRSSFQPARHENIQKATCRDIPEQAAFSILVQFYLRGRNRFSQLSFRSH